MVDPTAPPLTAQQLQHRYRQGERHFVGVNLRGESLRGINLSQADLSHTDLRGTDFSGATLTRTRFHRAHQVNLARLGKTILADVAVQALLITLRGSGKAYRGKNLQGANLAAPASGRLNQHVSH